MPNAANIGLYPQTVTIHPAMNPPAPDAISYEHWYVLEAAPRFSADTVRIDIACIAGSNTPEPIPNNNPEA